MGKRQLIMWQWIGVLVMSAMYRNDDNATQKKLTIDRVFVWKQVFLNLLKLNFNARWKLSVVTYQYTQLLKYMRGICWNCLINNRWYQYWTFLFFNHKITASVIIRNLFKDEEEKNVTKIIIFQDDRKSFTHIQMQLESFKRNISKIKEENIKN